MEENKRKGGTCRGCGIYIEWIKTKAGKNMPVDPAGVTIITKDGEVKKGFIPHWATCPKASSFRYKKKIPDKMKID